MLDKKHPYKWVFVLVTFSFLAIACGLLGGIGEQVGEVEETAKAVVTQAKGLATQVDQVGVAKTAQAVATEFAGEGDQILSTANALATQMLAEGGELQATAQAIATQGLDSLGEVPQDIPLIEDREQFVVTQSVVSYLTPLDFDQVRDFYKSEMLTNGWSPILLTTIETENLTVLNFEKDDRETTVTLSTNPVNQNTAVVIVLR
ncbi:MAG: hypothetical protein PVG32_10320 [Anaerolineales bacterium]|jgi:hypothetical protein